MRQLCIVLALAAAVRSGVAHAQTPAIGAASVQVDGARRPVPIAIAAPSHDERRRLEATLRDVLGSLPIDPQLAERDAIDPHEVTEPPPHPDAAVARVWIDLRPGVAIVYLVDGPWERVLVRRAPVPDAVDEVAREQIARIVQSAVEALLDGAVLGVAREEIASELTPRSEAVAETPPPATAPSRLPPPTPARAALRLGVGYEAQAWSAEAVAHGPLARLGLAVERDGARIGGAISAQPRVPVVVQSDPIGLRLDSVATRAMLDAAWPLGAAVRLGAGLGFGVDVLRSEPRARVGAENIVVEGTRTRIAPVLRGAVELELRLTRGARLSFALTLEADVANRAYAVARDAGSGVVEQVAIASPFVLRPGLALALSTAMLGH